MMIRGFKRHVEKRDFNCSIRNENLIVENQIPMKDDVITMSITYDDKQYGFSFLPVLTKHQKKIKEVFLEGHPCFCNDNNESGNNVVKLKAVKQYFKDLYEFINSINLKE